MGTTVTPSSSAISRALRVAEEMAWAMKDKSFAKKCRRLFEQGSRWMDEHLFNGEYYEHHITDPETFEFINMEGAEAIAMTLKEEGSQEKAKAIVKELTDKYPLVG